jgi:hypothetical protein
MLLCRDHRASSKTTEDTKGLLVIDNHGSLMRPPGHRQEATQLARCWSRRQWAHGEDMEVVSRICVGSTNWDSTVHPCLWSSSTALELTSHCSCRGARDQGEFHVGIGSPSLAYSQCLGARAVVRTSTAGRRRKLRNLPSAVVHLDPKPRSNLWWQRWGDRGEVAGACSTPWSRWGRVGHAGELSSTS